jgi:transglutaminase-like putative cysteine protease
MPSAPNRARFLDAVLPTTAAGCLVGLLAATWSGLWQQPPTGRLAVVAVVGVLPALVRATGIRRAGSWAGLVAVAAAVVALGAAVGSNPIELVRGDGPTWSALGDIIPSGFGDAATTPLPLSPDRAPALAALLVLVLAGLVCLIAWQIVVSRRPLAGIIAATTGLAYRWTLVPPHRPVLAGVLTLIIALAAFRLGGPRRTTRANSGRTALVGGMVVALALAGSIGADRAPASWWSWRDWTFGAGQAPTSLSLKQNYGPLDFPADPVLVARVAGDEPIPLRMVALEGFDGTSFVPVASTEPSHTTTTGTLRLTPDTQGRPRGATQRITIGNARSPFLLAGGRPSRVTGIGRRDVKEFADGSVQLNPALTGGTTYSVDTLIPDPGPAALLAAAPYGEVDPGLLTVVPGAGAPEVRVPVWSASGPTQLDPQVFDQYRKVYELSRRLIGGATQPYVAVNRIEEYLRSLEYDEATARSIGTPELVNFLVTTKRGYCQHFAGAMALMLRMNGIPARVVVGFTTDSGRFDRAKNSYEIIDRDAHSWVEVQFPGYGWIPFDPTPGRSVPNSASVSSPNYSRDGIPLDINSEIAPAPVRPAPVRDPTVNEPRFNDSGSSGGGSDPGRWLSTIVGVLLAALLTPVCAKAVRRRRRQRGDERMRVLGAAREFESLLLDLGHPTDPAATTAERAHASWRELGIDAAAIYGLASVARFDPSQPRAGSGDQAWRELRQARRTISWRRRVRASLRIRSLRA